MMTSDKKALETLYEFMGGYGSETDAYLAICRLGDAVERLAALERQLADCQAATLPAADLRALASAAEAWAAMCDSPHEDAAGLVALAEQVRQMADAQRQSGERWRGSEE